MPAGVHHSCSVGCVCVSPCHARSTSCCLLRLHSLAKFPWISTCSTRANIHHVLDHVTSIVNGILHAPPCSLEDAVSKSLLVLDHDQPKGKRVWPELLANEWHHNMKNEKQYETILPLLSHHAIAVLRECKRKVHQRREEKRTSVMVLNPPYDEALTMVKYVVSTILNE